MLPKSWLMVSYLLSQSLRLCFWFKVFLYSSWVKTLSWDFESVFSMIALCRYVALIFGFVLLSLQVMSLQKPECQHHMSM